MSVKAKAFFFTSQRSHCRRICFFYSFGKGSAFKGSSPCNAVARVVTIPPLLVVLVKPVFFVYVFPWKIDGEKNLISQGNEVVLKYPDRIVVAHSNRLLSYSQQARDTRDEEVIFDLTGTTFLTPFGIVLLAGTISECLSQQKKVGYRKPRRRRTREFLSGIGFNEFFRLSDVEHNIESSHVQLRRLDSINPLLTPIRLSRSLIMPLR